MPWKTVKCENPECGRLIETKKENVVQCACGHRTYLRPRRRPNKVSN